MRLNSTHLGLVAAALLVTGCAGTDRTYGSAPGIEVTDLTELPAPTQQQTYRIAAQEMIEIEVVGAEELSGTFLTDPEGNLQYPLLGEVATSGLTPTEASRMLEDRLRGDFLRNPQVRVIPSELPASAISIGGEVAQPGTYPAETKLSLLRAINLAGGLDEYAKLDDVLIMREVDGQEYIGLYNLAAIQRGNYPDPEIYPNDIIMVGDSPGRRRVDRLVAISLPLLSTTAVVLNQANRR